jgi:secreted trypsin-like serine protease
MHFLIIYIIGGMVFPLKNSDFTRWFLQGIVSVGFADDQGKCKASQYSIFTRVGRYADWIVRTLSEQDAL